MSTRSIPFTTRCRECGREVHRPMPAQEYENVPGIRVFCAACESTNWATKD